MNSGKYGKLRDMSGGTETVYGKSDAFWENKGANLWHFHSQNGSIISVCYLPRLEQYESCPKESDNEADMFRHNSHRKMLTFLRKEYGFVPYHPFLAERTNAWEL